MTEETTQIVVLKQSLGSIETQLAKVLPSHIDPKRLIQVALTAVNRNPDLFRCTHLSVVEAVMQAGELGLDFSPAMGQAYLVPFGDQCTLIPGYRGLADLARRSHGIEIEAECVFESDQFSWHRGTKPEIIHNPDMDHGREDPHYITHAYAVATFPNGRQKFDVMTRAQIEEIRKISKQPNGMLWKLRFHEAARKTVVRRLCKYLPMSPEMAKAVDLGDTEFSFDPSQAEGAVPVPERTHKLADDIKPPQDTTPYLGDSMKVSDGRPSDTPVDPVLAQASDHLNDPPDLPTNALGKRLWGELVASAAQQHYDEKHVAKWMAEHFMLSPADLDETAARQGVRKEAEKLDWSCCLKSQLPAEVTS